MSKPLDPFKDLDKRARMALRQALKSDGTGAAPTQVVKKLESKGLVTRSGHMHEPEEWGKVVRRWPVFWLTPAGKEVAQAIVDKLNAPSESLRDVVTNLRALVEASHPWTGVAKKVDSIRKRGRRLIAKARGENATFSEPEKLLSTLSQLGHDMLAVVEPAVAAMKQVLAQKHPDPKDYWTKSFVEGLQYADKFIGYLKNLTADPMGYTKSSRLSFGGSQQTDAVLHYGNVFDELFSALRKSEARADHIANG